MTGKEFLSRPKELKQEIRCGMDNLAALRALAEGCSSRLIRTDQTRSRGNRGGVEDLFLSVREEEERVNELIRALARCEKAALDVICRVKDHRKRTLLMMRYIRDETWEDIMEALDLSKSRAYFLHHEGLEEVETILREETGKEEENE